MLFGNAREPLLFIGSGVQVYRYRPLQVCRWTDKESERYRPRGAARCGSEKWTRVYLPGRVSSGSSRPRLPCLAHYETIGRCQHAPLPLPAGRALHCWRRGDASRADGVSKHRRGPNPGKLDGVGPARPCPALGVQQGDTRPGGGVSPAETVRRSVSRPWAVRFEAAVGRPSGRRAQVAAGNSDVAASAVARCARSFASVMIARNEVVFVVCFCFSPPRPSRDR